MAESPVFSHESAHTKSKEDNTVMINKEDYFSILESLYLLSVPGLKEKLVASKKHLCPILYQKRK